VDSYHIIIVMVTWGVYKKAPRPREIKMIKKYVFNKIFSLVSLDSIKDDRLRALKSEAEAWLKEVEDPKKLMAKAGKILNGIFKVLTAKRLEKWDAELIAIKNEMITVVLNAFVPTVDEIRTLIGRAKKPSKAEFEKLARSSESNLNKELETLIDDYRKARFPHQKINLEKEIVKLLQAESDTNKRMYKMFKEALKGILNGDNFYKDFFYVKNNLRHPLKKSVWARMLGRIMKQFYLLLETMIIPCSITRHRY